jgi:hypothetical protein
MGECACRCRLRQQRRTGQKEDRATRQQNSWERWTVRPGARAGHGRSPMKWCNEPVATTNPEPNKTRCRSRRRPAGATRVRGDGRSETSGEMRCKTCKRRIACARPGPPAWFVADATLQST